MLTERKHIALLGAFVALASPAVASAAPLKDGKLPPRVRLRAEVPPAANAIGDAVAVDGPLLDPVDRFSRLIAVTTQRTEHRQKVHHRKQREAKEVREEEEQFAQLPGGVSMGTLESIAACESGGNPGTDTGNGFYGKYQFTLSTWQSVGGSGNPAAASEAEQNQRAALLYAREGASPWPVCGR